MLSEVQRTELRRVLGYPNLANQASVQLGYPGYASAFAQWQPYAWLESRLETASPAEEVAIYGEESLLFSSQFVAALLAFVISTPSSIANGAVLALTLAGVTIDVNAGPSETPATFAAKVQAAIKANGTANQVFVPGANGAQFSISALSPGRSGNGSAVQALSNDPSLLVALAVPVGTLVGQPFAIGVTNGGSDPPGETVTLLGQTQTIYGYMPIVRILEGDLVNARAFLFIDKADVFTSRKDEIGARKAMLRHYRLKIAERLNVPLDPDLVGNRSRRRFRAI